MVRKSKADESSIKWVVTQIGSPIGRNNIQRLNLIGLGLNKIGRSATISLNPSTEGMINKVKHLVKIEQSK